MFIYTFTASQTVKDLGNLIEGLDNLLKSNSQADVDTSTQLADTEEMVETGESSSTSLQPPPMNKLLSQTGLPTINTVAVICLPDHGL